MALYCCLSLHFTLDLYNLWTFFIHLCSYISLLLNNWYTPMAIICCFSFSICNNPLRMKHLCSNYSISIIESITLVNACDFLHCSARAVFPSDWKQISSFTEGGIFWPVVWVVLLCLYCSESDTNTTWALVEVAPWFFPLGVSNYW